MRAITFLSFEKSHTTVLLLIWSTMMLTYYGTRNTPPVIPSKSIFETICQGPAWVSEPHALSILAALAMTLMAAVAMFILGNFQPQDRPLKPPAVRKYVAGFLMVCFSIFLSYAFLPCEAVLEGPGASSTARAGRSIIKIGQRFFPVYALFHTLLLFNAYFAVVIAVQDLRTPPRPLGR